MELLYGGTARRIGYEGGRAQNRARIEMLGFEEAGGPRHDNSSQDGKECSRRRPQVFASAVASCFAELCAYAFPPKQYQAWRQQGIREPCEVACPRPPPSQSEAAARGRR